MTLKYQKVNGSTRFPVLNFTKMKTFKTNRLPYQSFLLQTDSVTYFILLNLPRGVAITEILSNTFGHWTFSRPKQRRTDTLEPVELDRHMMEVETGHLRENQRSEVTMVLLGHHSQYLQESYHRVFTFTSWIIEVSNINNNKNDNR